MITPAPSPARYPVAAMIACIAGLALASMWLWVQWCRFPWSSWNNVRLTPSFMLAAGEPVYTAPSSGVIGTWMYGPVPVWLLLPATWMQDLVSATLVAGALNILFQVAAIILVCAFWPSARRDPWVRLASCGLVFAVWPGAAWQFIQADNFAVALGLLSSLALLRSPRSPLASWMAAIAAAAALGCKQTSVGIPLAQLAWLASTHGPRAVLYHALRMIAAGAAIAVLALALFDPIGLWDTLVRVPGSLPWTDQPFTRATALATLLVVHLLVPAAIFLALRSENDPVCARGLALWLWLASLPLGLMSLMKVGGTINSLQGLQLALPALALSLCERFSARPRAFFFLPFLGASLLALRALETGVPAGPQTTHLRQGVALARAQPGVIWFPWHPLITYFSESRFYHAEDGLYVRLMAGRALDARQLYDHLPPRFSAVAETAGGTGWGVSERLLNHRYAEETVGLWRLRRTLPPTSPDLPPANTRDVNPSP